MAFSFSPAFKNASKALELSDDVLQAALNDGNVDKARKWFKDKREKIESSPGAAHDDSVAQLRKLHIQINKEVQDKPYSWDFITKFEATFPTETKLHEILHQENISAAERSTVGQAIAERRRNITRDNAQDPDGYREAQIHAGGYAALHKQWEKESKAMEQQAGRSGR